MLLSIKTQVGSQAGTSLLKWIQHLTGAPLKIRTLQLTSCFKVALKGVSSLTEVCQLRKPSLHGLNNSLEAKTNKKAPYVDSGEGVTFKRAPSVIWQLFLSVPENCAKTNNSAFQLSTVTPDLAEQ